MRQVCQIGPDIAKEYFQVHGVNKNGKDVFNKKLKRKNVLSFFANLPPCLVGLEVCGGAHYRAMYDPAENLHPERKRPQDAFHPAAAERINPHPRYFARSQNSAIFISRFSFNSETENLIVRLSRTLSSSSSLSMIMTCFLPTALPEALSSSIM